MIVGTMLGWFWFFVAEGTAAPLDDADLLDRFLEGDQEAFAALVRRYEKPLYGFLRRFTGDAALAEDVFQETFLKVHQSAAMFEADRRFRPWLYTIAANKARDALRKRGRRSAAPLDAKVGDADGASHADLLPSEILPPDETCANLETRQAVQVMIDQLPASRREVLILSYFQELPHKDIAEILDVPVGTVKSRLHAAIRQFAEKWNAYLARQNRSAPSQPSDHD